MDAEIQPLEGKYYGTIIKLLSGPASGQIIKIWLASGVPSDRELEKSGYTREDWDKNVEVPDGWGGKVPVREICLGDTHYECVESYRIAQALVQTLKEM